MCIYIYMYLFIYLFMCGFCLPEERETLYAQSPYYREFKDVVFEDVVFDNNRPVTLY